LNKRDPPVIQAIEPAFTENSQNKRGETIIAFLYIFIAFYPLSVELKDCSSLFWTNLKDVALFRVSKGKPVPVPFQIDEKRNGNYRMDWILKAGEWIGDALEKGDLYISEDDELLFYKESLGEKSYFKGIRGCEIEVDGKFLYLLESKRGKTVQKNGRYNRERRVFEGRYFSIGFTDLSHPANLNFLKIKGGSNIIDRLRIKLNLPLFGRWKFFKTEEDFSGNITGYKEGPLRSFIKQKLGLEITNWGNLFSHEGFIEIYEDAVKIPLKFYIPEVFASASSELIITIDFNEKIDGSILEVENSKVKCLIDGKISEFEKSLNGLEAPGWFRIRGKGKDFLVILKEEREINKKFFYDEERREFGWSIKLNEGGNYPLSIILLKAEGTGRINTSFLFDKPRVTVKNLE
jgi:hypothetical protein